MRRVIGLAMLLAVMVVVGAWRAAPVQADGICLTRDEAITVVAHKADVEYGVPWVKATILDIAERESRLTHCDAWGNVRVSPTNDHGLLQLNPAGVWRNCAVNPHCGRWWMIDDAAAQVDVMLRYYRLYGDLCPWNPRGNYLPGCGYP